MNRNIGIREPGPVTRQSRASVVQADNADKTLHGVIAEIDTSKGDHI